MTSFVCSLPRDDHGKLYYTFRGSNGRVGCLIGRLSPSHTPFFAGHVNWSREPPNNATREPASNSIVKLLPALIHVHWSIVN